MSKKISELVQGSCKATDLYVAVDTTDNSMAPSGTNKKYTLQQVMQYVNGATLLTTGTNLVGWNNYVSNGATLLNHTLPLTCDFGATIEIAGMGAGLFKISQNVGQQIILGSAQTTLGATGFLTSTQQYDAMKFRCIVQDTIFQVIYIVGNPTLN